MRAILWAALSVAAIFGSGLYLYTRSQNKAAQNFAKPNILVISTCSLRHDAVADMPRVNEFFGQGSYIFSNAFNGLGWTALFSVTAPEIRRRFFGEVGYEAAGQLIKDQMYLVPPRNSWKTGHTREQKQQGLTEPDSNFEKNYRESLEFLLSNLSQKRMLPYFIVAQIKYAHFPLVDRYNSDSGWDQFLSPEEKKRVQTYLANPKRYAAKLPFLLMLTNDSKTLRAHPQVDKAIADEVRQGGHDSAFLGLLNTPKFLLDWQSSPDYEIDLTILKKIYRANVIYMDKIVGELLQRLNDTGGLDNTVVIFAGDHGEVHMERGHLTHGTSWFDPALRIPLMVRFPGQGRSVTLTDQTNFFTVTKIITGIAEGKINQMNFSERLKEIADPVVIGRDCANTWRAIRYDNKWKYAVDNSSGEGWLYDLTKDPQETVNLIGEKPGVVAELEALYWKRLPRLSNQMVNTCAPWPGPKALREDN